MVSLLGLKRGRGGFVSAMAMILACACFKPADTAVCDILAFGAMGDGVAVNTSAIQKAIDQCAGKGDTVVVPAGSFLTGPVEMKSNLVISIAKGGTLLGLPMRTYYSGDSLSGGKTLALMNAYDQNDLTLEGEGTLDGNGGAPDFLQGDNGAGRPRLLQMVRCRNVTVRNLVLKAPAFWTAYFLACVTVRISGLRIDSHANWNNDGLDIDSKDVLITDCAIHVDDDALCLKSDIKGAPCENVTVRRCTLSSSCNVIKLGTSSRGGFLNIDIDSMDIRAPANYSVIRKRRTALAGIALESVDGGILDGVRISDVRMEGIMTPIFIKLGDRQKPAGTLRNVTISHVEAFPNSRICSNITGIPGGTSVENVTLSDILIHVPGGGTAFDAAATVPEVNDRYPEILTFGLSSFPAYGMFIRHAKNISLRNVRYELLASDFRPTQLFVDVQGLDTSGRSAGLMRPGISDFRPAGLSRVYGPGLDPGTVDLRGRAIGWHGNAHLKKYLRESGAWLVEGPATRLEKEQLNGRRMWQGNGD